MKINKQALFFALFIIISVYCWASGNKDKGTAPQTQSIQQAEPQTQAEQQRAPQSAPPPTPLYWTGDGGSGISLGILVPESEGLGANLAYLPTMIQGVLVTNISRYSAISVLDRESLDRVIAETLDPTYEDNLDIVRLGHVAHVGYMMTGKIIRTSTGYTLQINVTDTTPNARTIASYSSTATVAQLDDHTAIQTASRELLTQMGVQLTDRAITALGTTNSQQSINGETTLARAITAQRNGTVVEALSYYYQAKEFDPSLLEAANRASVLSAAITSGNIGESVRNDIQWRNEWLRILREAAEYFRQNPLFEIVCDPTLTQGRINYNNSTVELSFNLAFEPSSIGFNILETLVKGLHNTGKSREWGLNRWPYAYGVEAAIFIFDGATQRFFYDSYNILATLLDQNGRHIGEINVQRHASWLSSLSVSRGGGNSTEGIFRMPLKQYVFVSSQGSSPPAPGKVPFTFAGVKADDITDNLSISISVTVSRTGQRVSVRAITLRVLTIIFGGFFMLYKLRNNASAFADRERNMSTFAYVRSASIPGTSSYAEALSHEALELSVIVEKIEKTGDNSFVIPTTPNTVAVLIEETLKLLEDYGFVISGNTKEELNEKEIAGYRK